MTPEGKLQKECMDWLRKTYPENVHWKIADRYTSGIPDIQSYVGGKVFIIELKKPGEEPSDLQAHNLKMIRANGQVATWVDNFEDFKKVFEMELGAEETWGGRI